MAHPGHQITNSLGVYLVSDAVHISQSALFGDGLYVSGAMILEPGIARLLGEALIEMAALAPESESVA